MTRFFTLFLMHLLLLRAAVAGPLGAQLRAGSARARALVAQTAPSQVPVPALSVYPNPAHGQTTVQVNGPGGADYKLRLSNVLGSEVRRLSVRPENQAAEGVALDLSSLPPGLYFCSLLVNDKMLVTKRLTVQ